MQRPRITGRDIPRLTAFARPVDVLVLTLTTVMVASLLGLELWAQHNGLAIARRLSVQVEELEAAGDYPAAIPLAEKAVVTYEGVLGPEHQETATARGRLAVLYLSSGAFEKAEAALRRSFATFQKRLGGLNFRGLLSGRTLLKPDEQEPEGYGLYSYLLFEAPPKNEAERSRYLKALEAYLAVLQPMSELERYKRLSQLNVTLIPVRDVALPLPADPGEPNRASQTAELVLAAYDYARAKVLLDDLETNVTRSGPYLISRVPGATTVRLFLDMSHVAPKLTWDWMRAFCWLAAQERSWSEVSLQRLGLNIRNAVALTADGTTDVVSGLQQWIQLVKVK